MNDELKDVNDPSEPIEGPLYGGSEDTGGDAGGGLGIGDTDPVLKDAGPPAEGVADPEGSSGAEEGIAPWHPEAYDEDPEGPTTVTD